MAHYKGTYQQGARAMGLTKRRQEEREALEMQKRRKEEETARMSSHITDKFSSQPGGSAPPIMSDKELRHGASMSIGDGGGSLEGVKKQYGLVTLEEMKEFQRRVEEERERKIAAAALEDKKKPKKKKKKSKAVLTVSFDPDEGIDEDAAVADGANNSDADEPPKKRLGKNPTVDTSFLPDRDREEEERKERDRLRVQYLEEQKRMKEEKVEITYSYWDGSGHRRSIVMKKGDSIGQFLQACIMSLRKDFYELRAINSDQLMYVKEDLIIPHHYTFYDFIVTKARGKSGPLFDFGVSEDVRMQVDVSRETAESHAGKVVLRSWYERHKHIFPASRWEDFDPNKKWDKYTIGDRVKKD